MASALSDLSNTGFYVQTNVIRISNMRISGFFYLIIILLYSDVALAENITLDVGNLGNNPFTSGIIKIVGLLTILSLAPSIVMMVTSFSRIIIILSLLRTAIGLQQTPPTVVLTSLAMFMTFFIMSPVLEESYKNGIEPLMNQTIDEMKGLEKAAQPFHQFMLNHTRPKDLATFVELSNKNFENQNQIPFSIIIPGFMISELKRAFEIGFLLFLPFLIIDMLVSSILMAIGMMMLPPVMVSLPFKLIFFVLVDGWNVLCVSLVQSYI